MTNPLAYRKISRVALLSLLVAAVASEDYCRAPSDDEILPPAPRHTKPLSNGVEMPVLSLGMAHASFGSQHRDNNATFVGFTPERAYRQVELALQNGVRSFDTALMYGTQPHLGMVLGQWWASGRLSRDDVWITTKVFHLPAPGFGLAKNHQVHANSLTPEKVTKQTEEHIEQCLTELGVGYIDLLLMHWPSGPGQPEEISRQRRLAAWTVLETFYERGWLRAIGVSNFSGKHLQDLMDDGAKIRPMVNQIEASPYIQYDKIVRYCQENSIEVQSFSPMGSGTMNVKDDPVLQQLAKEHGKDVGQVVFRYLIQKGYAGVAFLTNNPSRMMTNQQVFDFELSDKEMKMIDGLNRPDGSFLELPGPQDLP